MIDRISSAVIVQIHGTRDEKVGHDDHGETADDRDDLSLRRPHRWLGGVDVPERGHQPKKGVDDVGPRWHRQLAHPCSHVRGEGWCFPFGDR